MTSDADDDLSPCASPPCFMHEADPAYMGLAATADPQRCIADKSGAYGTKAPDTTETCDSTAGDHSPLPAPHTGSEESDA